MGGHAEPRRRGPQAPSGLPDSCWGAQVRKEREIPYGYSGKILKVNLTDRTWEVDEPPESFYRQYLGGSGIGLHYILEEVPAGADPLGPENVLTFGVGVVTGAAFSGNSRISANARSPSPVHPWIKDGAVEIRDALHRDALGAEARRVRPVSRPMPVDVPPLQEVRSKSPTFSSRYDSFAGGYVPSTSTDASTARHLIPQSPCSQPTSWSRCRARMPAWGGPASRRCPGCAGPGAA